MERGKGKRGITMKKGFILILLITVLFTTAAAFSGEDSIVICSSLEQFRGEALQEQLNEAFPDKHIIVMYMPTGKAAAKVLTEGTHTEIDIMVGLETGYLNRISPYLADVSGYSRVPFLEEFRTEKNGNLWVTWEKQAGAIVVNRTVLEKYGLPTPSSYADLLKEEYRGLIAMPDPKSSGTGYFFYKSLVNSFGEEKALAYIDALHGQLKQLTESGSGPIKLLKQGEIGIGLALTFQAVSEIGKGQPFDIIFPEQGSPYSLTGTAMIEGREKNRDIQEVFDFIVNDFLVYDKEYFSPEQIFENQVNRIENYPENIPYADMTGIQDYQEKERLLALWKY